MFVDKPYHQRVLASIDDNTLLKLIQKSFSKFDITLNQAKALARAMLMLVSLSIDIPAIRTDGPSKVYFTHDIDWLNPMHPYSLIKKIMPFKKWLSVSQILQSDIYIRNVEKLLLMESDHHINSVFMLGASNKKSSLNRFDIRYTINEPLFLELIELLKQNHVLCGLHSQKDIDIVDQVDSLGRVCGNKISYHRRHYSMFDMLTMWNELENCGVEYDFSLARSHYTGFVSGIKRHFQAIDFRLQIVRDIHVVPTILYDNAFLLYSKELVLDRFKRAVDDANKFGSQFAILFHPENMLLHPVLWEYYEEVITYCKSSGVEMKTT
jgi:hypothetical protein